MVQAGSPRSCPTRGGCVGPPPRLWHRVSSPPAPSLLFPDSPAAPAPAAAAAPARAARGGAARAGPGETRGGEMAPGGALCLEERRGVPLGAPGRVPPHLPSASTQQDVAEICVFPPNQVWKRTWGGEEKGSTPSGPPKLLGAATGTPSGRFGDRQGCPGPWVPPRTLPALPISVTASRSRSPLPGRAGGAGPDWRQTSGLPFPQWGQLGERPRVGRVCHWPRCCWEQENLLRGGKTHNQPNPQPQNQLWKKTISKEKRNFKRKKKNQTHPKHSVLFEEK